MAPFPQSNKQLGGPLSQLHNLINRRNVVTKVARLSCSWHSHETPGNDDSRQQTEQFTQTDTPLVSWQKKYLRLQTVGTIINRLYYCLYLRL